jgi:hypothetical protein
MNNQALLVLVPAMQGVILISLCTLFYQILKQQGRILLRLDSLDQSAAADLAAEAEQAELEPGGLSVGAQFPAFRFPDVCNMKVGVGITITQDPSTEPDERSYRIRLLP